MYFMDLQEAANVFENFTIKYRKTTLGEEQPRVDKLRSETIFKVAVAFEKVVLSYGKYHLSGTNSSKRIVRDNICEYLHDWIWILNSEQNSFSLFFFFFLSLNQLVMRSPRASKRQSVTVSQLFLKSNSKLLSYSLD